MDKMWPSSSRDVKYTLLILGWLWCVASPVRIKELRVPAVARHGAAVVLDCDYTLARDESDEGLVVKWYLNDQSRPVYQWIPGGTGGPRGLGVLNGRLNLAYRASEDKRTEHRALHIPASTRDVAGNYTCKVSTFHGEDRQTKTMLVFVPEKSLRLQRRRAGDGALDAICSAEGVYPQPEMIIRITYDNVSYALDGGSVLHRQRDGLYDVSLNAPLPSEDHVTRPSPVGVTCELSIPVANYTVHKELLYYPGNASRSDRYTWVVLTAYGVVKYILNF